MMDHNKITFLVPTFERPDECLDTVGIINSLYPECQVLVCDDSEHLTLVSRLPIEDVEFTGITLPPDSGISAKRNRLVQEATTEFVVLLDDDNKLQAGSIEALWDALERAGPQYAVAGMAKNDQGRKRWANTEGRLNWQKNRLFTRAPSGDVGRGFLNVHFLPMCFLARREILLEVPFDERYKTCGEHYDFFFRLAAANGHRPTRSRLTRLQQNHDGPLDVPALNGRANSLFVPGPYFVDTASQVNHEYKAKRKRGRAFRKRMERRWGITGISKWNKSRARFIYEGME